MCLVPIVSDYSTPEHSDYRKKEHNEVIVIISCYQFQFLQIYSGKSVHQKPQSYTMFTNHLKKYPKNQGYSNLSISIKAILSTYNKEELHKSRV